MRVSEAMSRPVNIAGPDESICEVARVMKDHNIGTLPVGENDRLIGMISDRDITIRAVAAMHGPDTKIRDVMSKSVLYCFEDDDVQDVAENMGRQQVRRLPVLNRDKRLVGIVALADIADKAHPSVAGQAVKDICKLH